MTKDDNEAFTEEEEGHQQDRLDAELKDHDEHLEQEDRDTGRGEDLDGRMNTEGEDEEPPKGSPDHERGVISGN